ncbi:LysR substrate-binding domain-containing protein [Vibrio sp. YYF0003]|uniref:LysR substrate-binding domain-containing protein n=1 Tax=Vibrio sp. YYF0003 TaxID=3116646 RepID=UPI002EAF1C4F|nr:LysR substrate-binding domain-containing protein [Vibrio sp. YYF0003]
MTVKIELRKYGEPKTPYDLPNHACIDIRHRPEGAVYAWEFEKDGKEFTVKGKGQIVFNSIIHVLNAAVDGIGLGFVPEELARPYLDDGKLKTVLTDWTPHFPGFHLYYPNRRQSSPAFLAFVEAFKHTNK